VARMGRPELSREVQAAFWDGIGEGLLVKEAAVRAGASERSGWRWMRAAGGVRRPVPAVSGRYLRAWEREEIAVGLAAGDSCRVIAARLAPGRSASTVSREVRRNGADGGYRAGVAQRAARERARRPKAAKLAVNGELREWVEGKLALRWSPQQASARLKAEFPGRPEMRVSAETIYQSLYVQSRGALRRELAACLRSGRAIRRPRRPAGQDGRGKIPGMVSISERPAEAADRAVPGHWEGDLIIGKGGKTQAGTLVERATRFTMLIPLPAGRGPEAFADAAVPAIAGLPDALRRSLTWDQGKEMTYHARIAADAGVDVYFADPHSPWQRGSNENTNGLLRQYFPKGTDVPADPGRLQAVADELNGRPRKTLGWKTPAEALAAFLDQQAA
jgi:IS30 family transposase